MTKNEITPEKDDNNPDPSGEKFHPWEEDLKSYPLRGPEEDPGWAIKTVKIWLGIAIASGVFILALIILGFFYD